MTIEELKALKGRPLWQLELSAADFSALLAVAEAAKAMLHTVDSMPVDSPHSHMLNRDRTELRTTLAALETKEPRDGKA